LAGRDGAQRAVGRRGAGAQHVSEKRRNHQHDQHNAWPQRRHASFRRLAIF
jgi:hypothetical protein